MTAGRAAAEPEAEEDFLEAFLAYMNGELHQCGYPISLWGKLLTCTRPAKHDGRHHWHKHP